MPVTIDGTTGITTPAENTSALTVGSITGILKATSGVVSQAVAGTDYLVGGGLSFATRTQLLNSTGNNTAGTFTGSINLASFPTYSTASMVQLYIYMLSQAGQQPTGPGQNYINLTVGTDSYGTVLYHSNDSSGNAWFSDNNTILIDTRTSKTINYSVDIFPASSNVTYAIFAIGKN